MGIYGGVSFLVRQRTREIGIRIAFGAERRDIYSAVFRSSLWPVVSGIVVGESLALIGTWLMTRLMNQAALFNLHDPLVFVGVPLLLTAVAFAAILVPARGAAACDPAQALRQE